MRYTRILPIVLLLVSCSKEPSASGPRATVLLRDGTQVSGQIVSSSPTQMVVREENNATRTLEMAQVRSVTYADAPPPSPASPQTSATSAVPPAEAERDTARTYPEESAIRSRTNTLAAGTQVVVRTDESIDSAKAVEGQTFAASVVRAVKDADGDVVIPKGANATVVIRSASKGGRFKGRSDLVLDLRSVSVGGRLYALDTTDLTKKGRQGVGANKRTATFGGTGAAIGAIIGAIAGGGKGAAIGAGAGAGAGVLTQVITKGGSIKVPAETVLTFQLDAPLRVVAAQ